MRCLVTGASGLVGGRLAGLLCRQGYDVRCLVRRTSRTAHLRALPLEYVYGDVLDAATLPAAVRDVDWVLHVAGATRARDADEFVRVNAGGAEHLLRACVDASRRPAAIVVVSSLAAAGPTRDGHPIREDEEPWPISAYGRSKAHAEAMVQAVGEGLAISIVRPPAVYGPGDRELLPLFRLAKLGIAPRLARRHLLSLVHVDDLALGIVAAAQGARPGGRVYHLAHPEIVELGDLLALMASTWRGRVWRVTVPRSVIAIAAELSQLEGRLCDRPNVFDVDKGLDLAQRGWVCSVERARSELGFVAPTDARSGIPATAEWYQSAGWL